MPCRNIGWGWHLASPSEIAAWQLEVNKSWSCEKWLPCLLAQSPLPSPATLSQTTQHVVFTSFISHQHQWNGEIEWRKSQGNSPPHPPFPAIKITPRCLINVCACVCFNDSFFFLFIYLASPALKRTCMCFLQPVLRQEKLWKQERDSVRPRDHRQVGCTPLLLSACERGNESVNEWATKFSSGWVDERAKPGNKRAPSWRARRPSWADLHLIAHSVGTAGDSLWAAEGRLSQVPVHRGAVTTWMGSVQSQVVQSQEDHAGKIPN